MKDKSCAAPAACAAAVAIMLNGAVSHAEPTAPAASPEQLRWDQPIRCLRGPKGRQLFVQCDVDRKRCLFHDGCIPGTSGARCERMERLAGCGAWQNDELTYQELRKRGMRFEAARAESPPGWTRDERGRVFQTEFDMNRRGWLGARYRPSYGPQDRYEVGRVGFETGLRAEWLSDDTRTRHRVHLLEGELTINPLGARALLLRYDTSRESGEPLLRITTFWPPERHDLYMNLGWFAEAGGLEFRPRSSQDETLLRFVGAGLTWDLWHSLELDSYARLRVGAAFEDLYLDRDDLNHRLALTPLAWLESDVLFDPAGLHRLTVRSGIEPPLIWLDDEHALPSFRVRFLNEAAYELVVVAINDQPLSLRIAASGGYRSDLDGEASGWELGGAAGLRVNFWAPAPDPDDRQRVQELRGP